MKRWFKCLWRKWRRPEPFKVDDIKIVEDLGGGKFLTRAYYQGKPVGREVVLLTTPRELALRD